MPTISDVAKLAGVSAGTVSRVMNGAENVQPDTRAKVEQAIADLGYQPNFQARSLRSKRTDIIALAIPELTNYFWTTIARGVQDAAQAKGFHVLVYNTDPSSHQHIRHVESIANRVDGMILTRHSERVVLTGDEGHPSHRSVNSREIPVVFVGQSQAANWNVDNVYSDSISGAFALTEHLIRLGHQNIAIITGRQSSTSASERVTGYCLALADASVPIDAELIYWGEYDRKTAERLTHDLVERKPGITAIVAANNEIAIGIVHALEKRHLLVPESIAVVCFDDFYPDSRFASTMTVATQSPYDIGINAAQLLLSRLNSDAYLRPRTVVLPLRLIVRQSCGGEPTPVDTDPSFDRVQGQLIPPLPQQKITVLAAKVNPVIRVALPMNGAHLLQTDKVQISLLKRVLHQEVFGSTPVPHFEYAITNRSLYRFVLEREPNYETVHQHSYLSPEDQVEFAQRTGIAAIPCRFPYQPVLDHFDSNWQGESNLLPFEFPLLTDQLDFFERYVRAARNTNVGIAADFRSIFADTLATIDTISGLHPELPITLLQKVADDLLFYQSKVVQLICDRFGADLAFVIFTDHLADKNGLRVPMNVFESVFSQRIQHLIQPAREHGLPTVLYTLGKLETVLSLGQQLGFDAVYATQPELDELTPIRREGNATPSLMGGIPVLSLVKSGGQSLAQQISNRVSMLASGGNYVVGAASEISDEVPLENFFALLEALSIAQS